MEDVKGVLEKIKEERKKQRKTLEYVAINLGFKVPSSYFKIEEGLVVLTFETYLKICKILNKKYTFFLK